MKRMVKIKIHDGDDACLESGEGKLLVKVKSNQEVRLDFILTHMEVGRNMVRVLMCLP
jgi:hypothetical protein